MSSVNENIPDGWVETTLGELIDIFNQKRVPLSTKVRNTRKGIYPYYGASNIVDYIDDFIFDGEYLLISEDGENLNTRNTPIAFIAKGKFWVNNHAHIVKGRETHLTKYLELYFSKLDISAYITGAVQPKLSKGNLINIPILISKSKDEQKAIANILTAFDDKIENLQAQNNTLEQTAQTIFKEWFGKYQIGDELPDGWRVGKIYEVLDVQYGYPFKSKLFNEDKKGLPLIRIRDIRKGETGYFTEEEYLDEYIVNSGDVIAGMDAIFQPYLWSGEIGLLNQRVCRFIPKEFASRIFVFEFMKPHLSFYEKTKVGTTVIHLGKSDLDFIETVIPSKDVIIKFQELSTPIEEKIINNNKQIQTLTQTRDTLLPKLMSGQLRVNEFKN